MMFFPVWRPSYGGWVIRQLFDDGTISEPHSPEIAAQWFETHAEAIEFLEKCT